MTNESMIDEDISIPLCVDLDGTLIKGDTTQKAAFNYAGYNPFKWGKIALWFGKKGHAYMKQKLAEHVTLTPEDWEFVPGMLELLEAEQKAGRDIFLVSATDQKFAQAVAQDPLCKKYLKKDHVIASEGMINLRSTEKANFLVEKFGKGKFIYAGNSVHDLDVWEKCVAPIIVIGTQNNSLLKKLQFLHQKTTVILSH